MVYVNLVGFGFLLAATIYFLVRTIRADGRQFYRDPEFYGLAMYAIAALSYFQAVARVVGGGYISLTEQRSINLIFMLTLAWSVMYTAMRKGFLDELFRRYAR
jgi:hypothetical protein